MNNLKDFEFKKIDGGYAVFEYLGDDKKVIIPDTFEHEPVVEVFNLAFADNINLVELVMPDSIINVGSSAFSRCVNLEKITFSNQLKKLSDQCFIDCKSLIDLDLPNSLEIIGYSAFTECLSLQSIFFDGDEIQIHDTAFSGCKSLENVSYNILNMLTLTRQVGIISKKFDIWNMLDDDEKNEILAYVKRKQSVKKAIFSSDCATGISILLSEKVKLTLIQLDKYLDLSIKNQNSLVTATLLDYKEKNFSNTEKEDFKENKELVKIGLEMPTLKQFKEKWKCSKIDGGIRVSGFKGELSELEIIPKMLADGTPIIMIKPSSTNSFANIKKLVIEAELTEILPKTFYFNSHLEEIVFPDTVKIIGKSTFDSAKKLRKVTFPTELEVICEHAFWCCKFLEEVTLFDGMKEIHENAFKNCENLKTVILPKSLETIEKHAFRYCKNLESVTVYSSTKVDDLAFEMCDKINIIVKEN